MALRINIAKNLLTALQVKQAKPKEKEYLLGDGGNLFVRIRPNGSKYFEVIVRINSKKRRISLGDATIISLEQARKLCEKELIRLKGLPKGMENKIDFETASNDFLEIKQKQWSQDHYKKALIYFKIFIEYFGKMEVGKINKSDILRSLAKYEKEQKRASFVKATNDNVDNQIWKFNEEFVE
ncbi:Arm DNA-binding domain-containing protein [Campylobacter sp.]|uniref:Arm DNA-binding domain-containing protein n=1 Tax=Campylobacter sp. TaxID=205 RepID=UPI002AA6F085|nr:Arm DNA-binding domain-containing protein [Campylobacter sp.]MCI6660768.1 Arm DNA-binding domain-containing protein [Campylobacter sp.]